MKDENGAKDLVELDQLAIVLVIVQQGSNLIHKSFETIKVSLHLQLFEAIEELCNRNPALPLQRMPHRTSCTFVALSLSRVFSQQTPST